MTRRTRRTSNRTDERNARSTGPAGPHLREVGNVDWLSFSKGPCGTRVGKYTTKSQVNLISVLHSLLLVIAAALSSRLPACGRAAWPAGQHTPSPPVPRQRDLRSASLCLFDRAYRIAGPVRMRGGMDVWAAQTMVGKDGRG